MNKRAAMAVMEVFISIVLVLSIVFGYLTINDRQKTIYYLTSDNADSIFNSKEIQSCIDQLEFGCYYNREGCLSKLDEFYRNELIVCISKDDILPELPNKEVGRFKTFKPLKNNSYNPFYFSLYFIKE